MVTEPTRRSDARKSKTRVPGTKRTPAAFALAVSASFSRMPGTDGGGSGISKTGWPSFSATCRQAFGSLTPRTAGSPTISSLSSSPMKALAKRSRTPGSSNARA